MLRIAVQSKGRLYEDTMALLAEADIKVSSSKRTLLVQASNFPIEVLYLRDDDIPQSVASGVADLGVVGENEFVEREEDAVIVRRLGFSKCRLSLAIPKTVDYPGLSWFNGRKIATSYPRILQKYMADNGVNADIHVITGSVEIAPGIGLADGIFDIVSSGSTLVSNNLQEVAGVMKSEALLMSGFTLMTKIGMAVGSAAVGWLLMLVPYEEGAGIQLQPVLDLFFGLNTLFPAVVFALVLLMSLPVRKMEKMLPAIKKELEKREANHETV